MLRSNICLKTINLNGQHFLAIGLDSIHLIYKLELQKIILIFSTEISNKCDDGHWLGTKVHDLSKNTKY